MYPCLLYDYNNLYLVLLGYDDTERKRMDGWMIQSYSAWQGLNNYLN